MALWVVVILLVLVVASIPVAAVLGILTFTLDDLYMAGRLKGAIGEFVWDKSKEFVLVAIPTIFAASSGSSVATAATVGTVAVPEMEKRNYNERLFLGSLAAGGTLGILIPPSINLIIYGLITDTSVPELYLAGIFPGALLAILFMLIIMVGCLIWRGWDGDKVETSWAARIKCLPDLIPPVLLFMVVVGSIYAGVATPTEAASVGVIFALVMAAWRRKLSIGMLKCCGVLKLCAWLHGRDPKYSGCD